MIESRSPQNPDDVVLTVDASSSAEVARAAEQARLAQVDWVGGGAAARSAALTAAAEAVAAAADELTALMVREVGKPLGEARGEVGRSVAILRYYAQQVFDPIGQMHQPSLKGLLYSVRHPRGIAGLITPWNFPLAIPLWKAAPALAFGNGVLLKPAPEATACAIRLAEIITPHLPDGLFHVLPGDVETGQAVVQAADVVSFTGSVAAGKAVALAATARGVAVQAEMGGLNPAIVLPDANIEAAANQIAAAVAGFAGQKCTATKRIIVVGDPTEFRDALVAAIEAQRVGDPAQAGVSAGPVIDAAARNRVTAAASSAVDAGGRILIGGNAIDGDGYFVQPTVVEGAPIDHLLACDEVFGPIALLKTAESAEEALKVANGVRYGLAAAVYTSNLATALDLSNRLEAGLVKVNAPTTGVDFYLPFGGEKDSSLGSREQGKAAQEIYTSTHTVAIAP
ncbi:MAG: aldehyde dehydrogenase family protein [Nakamurella sp.]